MFAMDCVESEDGSFADIPMAVFKVSAESCDERLKEFDVFGFFFFLEKEEGCATDMFVWCCWQTRASAFGQFPAERDARDRYG